MIKITKLDFELNSNAKVPDGLWHQVADYVKIGVNSYDRAKRRFAVTTLVSRINEIRQMDNTDESDFRLILMAEIHQIHSKKNTLTKFEQEMITHIISIFNLLVRGGVI